MALSQSEPVEETQRADPAIDEGTTPTEEIEEPPLPLDVVFDLLSNKRRRRVLRYLLEESDTTTLGDLAEHIAAIENDKPENELTSTERKRVYICLYQCHLPKMDDADVISFEEHRKTVTTGPTLPQIMDYLPSDDQVVRATEPNPRYYLAASALGLGAFIIQGLLYPVDWLSGLILGSVLVVVIGLTVRHSGPHDSPALGQFLSSALSSPRRSGEG